MTLTDLPHDTVFIDIEMNRAGRITELGAVRGDTELHLRAPLTSADLTALDRLARGAPAVAGHNVLAHDLPALQAAHPELALLKLGAIDTLVLSPLAWPDRPTHRLIKPYKTVLATENHPVADCLGSRTVLADALARFTEEPPASLPFLRSALGTLSPGDPWVGGFSTVFDQMGILEQSTARSLSVVIDHLDGALCSQAAASVLVHHLQGKVAAVPLAFALRWVEAAGNAQSHSAVLPAWVRHRFPDTPRLLDRLRGTPCQRPDCSWCGRVHSPDALLQHHFGYPSFRAEPKTATGDSLQREVVAAGLRGEPHFAAMPTGGGKSIGFQLPALARYTARGTLTVVVSPLQSLMQDQVHGLREKTQTQHAAALHGMLTSIERADVLEGVADGRIGLLYLSPEQTRNRSVQKALLTREIGAWVFDEAHCLSTWGHDFRTDYRYVLRFVSELAEQQSTPPPPISATTATAQLAVVDEICGLVQQHTGQALRRFISTTDRDNLAFAARLVPPQQRLQAVLDALELALGPPSAREGTGSAIVFVGSRKKSEEWAMLLSGSGWHADAFHAGLDPTEKRSRQDAFMAGKTRVMCATSAFGMGIDKDDVRLVVHVFLPSSLESYLQQAGRAGRDRVPAQCLLLYDPADTEAQFRLAADHELRREDIGALLRVVRSLSSEGETSPTVVSHGELMRLARARPFDPDSRHATTQINTAVSWLERAQLLRRDENRTRVFQGRLKHRSLKAARAHLAQQDLKPHARKRWAIILDALADRGASQAHDADALADLAGIVERRAPTTCGRRDPRFAGLALMRTLHQMVTAGLLTKGVELSAWVTLRTVGSSAVKLDRLQALEDALHQHIASRSTELGRGAEAHLSLREINEALLTEHNVEGSELAHIITSLRAMAGDGKGLGGGLGSLKLKTIGRSRVWLHLLRDWHTAVLIARKRHAVGRCILDFLAARVEADTPKARGRFHVEFALDELVDAIQGDLQLRSQLKRGREVEAVERALLWLHELDVLRLDRGLAIFRPAMTLRFDPKPTQWRYTASHHALLAEHYRSRTLQIHVMDAWARRAIEDPVGAAALARDWFELDRDTFLSRWLRDHRAPDLLRRTTALSHARIVTDLQYTDQQAIVTWKGSRALLVLAGPGSGKTRVIVHRCAWLVREQRVPHGSVLVLCYNRATALEVRQRLRRIIGQDAFRVDVFTFHGLALRLVGRTARGGQVHFESLMEDAARVLSEDSPLDGHDQRRDRILAGYEHILVDEYQDIDAAQYRLVSLVAGRSEKARTKGPRLRLTAVGDDDQNIYEFRQTSTEYIRRFEADYSAKTRHLLDNYRSTRRILDCAQALIRHDPHRLKQDQPLRIDRLRSKTPQDPAVVGEPVRLVSAHGDAAMSALVVAELRRRIQAGAKPESIAVLARSHRVLARLRQVFEVHGLPHVPPPHREGVPQPARLRPIAKLLTELEANTQATWAPTELVNRVKQWSEGPARSIVEPELLELLEESEGSVQPASVVLHRLWEAAAEARAGAPVGRGVRLATLHGVKGLEFDHVLIVDGHWRIRAPTERPAERRLLYVGMTRARHSLTLCVRADAPGPLWDEVDHEEVERHTAKMPQDAPALPPPVRFELIGMQALDLDWAGRQPSRHAVHTALAATEPGHTVTLEQRDGGVHVVDAAGRSIARLSRTGCERWQGRLGRVVQAQVYAVVRRTERDSKEGFRQRLRVPAWDVVVVEVRWR